ncbi:DUF3592 domain-containing protein [Corallococcus exiguus]|nr:DUF3592 domain-containing protein [Corallococcus exiguus]
MNLVLLVVFFFIGVPLMLMVRLLIEHQLTLELREQGVHARAEVVRIRRSWLNAGNRIVEYVFHLPDGSEIHGEYDEHRRRLLSRRTSEGDSLEVLYHPGNPHRHQRVGTEVGLFYVLTWVFSLMVFMSLAIIAMMNAPSKKAPAPHGSTPSGRLRTYDEPPPPRERRLRGEY